MATSVSVAQLDGWFKEVYGEVERAVPEFAEIQSSVPFSRREKLGDSYHFPVILTRAQGVTRNGGSAASFRLLVLDACSKEERPSSEACVRLRSIDDNDQGTN